MKNFIDNAINKTAEQLWQATMGDIQYGDSRDSKEWQKVAKEGFIAYCQQFFKPVFLQYHIHILNEEIERLKTKVAIKKILKK